MSRIAGVQSEIASKGRTMYLSNYNQNIEYENETKTGAVADQLLTTKEAAKYIGFKTNTLAVWRCNNRFDLKPLKIGRSVRYLKSELDKFLELAMQPE